MPAQSQRAQRGLELENRTEDLRFIVVHDPSALQVNAILAGTLINLVAASDEPNK